MTNDTVLVRVGDCLWQCCHSSRQISLTRSFE